MRQSLFPCLCLFLVGCSSQDPRQAQAARDRSNVDAVANAVRQAPRDVSTGRWDETLLTQRLVNAGLAPRSDDSVPAHPDYKVRPMAFRLGGAHLLAWIYGDSVSRRAVSATIDTLTAFPKPEPPAWAVVPTFVVQNNLIAVIVGGSDRQRERIRLAIEAGLPTPPG